MSFFNSLRTHLKMEEMIIGILKTLVKSLRDPIEFVEYHNVDSTILLVVDYALRKMGYSVAVYNSAIVITNPFYGQFDFETFTIRPIVVKPFSPDENLEDKYPTVFNQPLFESRTASKTKKFLGQKFAGIKKKMENWFFFNLGKKDLTFTKEYVFIVMYLIIENLHPEVLIESDWRQQAFTLSVTEMGRPMTSFKFSTNVHKDVWYRWGAVSKF